VNTLAHSSTIYKSLATAAAAIAAAPVSLYRSGWNSRFRDPLDPTSVAAALAFLTDGPVERVPLRRGSSSYGLKHDAECWARATGYAIGAAAYIANGDLIGAAVYMGIETSPAAGLNCICGIRVVCS
jgi:hypothetical protein